MNIPKKQGPHIDDEPGPWWRGVIRERAVLRDPRDDVKQAHLRGPCGHQMVLGKLHVVAADGTVSPSLVCPIAGCTFHEYVRLEGWADPDKVPT